MINSVLNRLYQYSIYKRLIGCFVCVLVLPILVIGSYNAMFSFSNNQKMAREFLKESSQQISNNISYYLFFHMNLVNEVADNDDIVRDLMSYDESGWKEKSEIENHIRLVLANTFGSSGAIDTVELISTDEAYFYNPSPISNGDFGTSTLLSTSMEEVVIHVGKKEIPSERENYVILSRGLYNKQNTCVGNIVAALDLSFFDKVCYENVTNLMNEVLIIDDNNTIISASDDDQVGSTFTGDQWFSISISTLIPGTQLTIVNRIGINSLLKSAFVQFLITLFIAVFFAGLAFVIALLVAKSIVGPIHALMEEMNKPDLEKHMDDDGDDEYHTLIEGFNEMSAHIVEAIKGQYHVKLKETELKELRKEAELSALQQQINPHFLYNTLESIYWNGQIEGDDDISEIVNALGNYLRVIIVKGREYVTVQSEVESVNNYIFLQNKRFGDRIINSWEVSATLKNTNITKLALHPIIEDIVSANLDDIEGYIYIHIGIVLDHKKVCIGIQGKGVGHFLHRIEDPLLDKRGLSSVDERLALYYGSEYGVRLDMENEVIRVTIPVYTGKQKERVG